MATIEPILESRTKADLDRLITKPSHAVLLTGPAGIGKTTIADWMLSEFAVGAHVLAIEPENGKTSIGVEVVRKLEHFVSLKMTSSKAINRIVRIDNAQLLTVEAQNAMLKTLEEPPVGTLFILTSPKQEALLATLRSRVQIIEIRKPPAESILAGLPTDADGMKIMALSGGLPGLAFALANHDMEHPLVKAAGIARELLQASSFERVSRVDVLVKDKEATRNLLYILMQMAHAALLTGRGTERWQQVLKASYNAETDLQGGAQPKLVLIKLMLEL